MTTDTAANAAAAPSARSKLNRRPKISLHADDAARLRLAARKRSLKPAVFMRQAILDAIKACEGQTPSAPPPAEATPSTATVRKKLFLSAEENTLLAREAKAAGLLQQDYVRLAVIAALTQAPPPKRKANASRNDLAHEIGLVAFQLKKTGTNLNQLAKQANTGLVPITRSEMIYLMNYHQRLLTACSAALEKVLA